MKNRIYIILLTLSIVCTACEHVIDYEGTQEDLSKGSMVINAVAIAGTPFSVFLTHAERADQAQVLPQHWRSDQECSSPPPCEQ